MDSQHSLQSSPQDPEKDFSPNKFSSSSRDDKCATPISDLPVATSSKPVSVVVSNTTINETQDVLKEFRHRMKDSSSSRNSGSELDFWESTTKTRESYEITMASTVTEGSHTSLSDDDSLGLLTESQINSAWCSDSGSEDLFPNFQKLDAVSGFKDFPQIFNWPNSTVEPEISPICAREKSSNIDLSTLESTPRIKQSVQGIGKSSTRYHEDILNKTVKISSVCSDSMKKTLTVMESDEESNLDNLLSVTRHIEIDKKIETSLNRTFGTTNILNKTLPSVISSLGSPSYLSSEENVEGIEKNVQYKTFTESPKEMIKETKSHACDPKTYELPVQAEHSQKRLSRTVTKIKCKKSMENSPNSSWNTLDSTITLYPQNSVSETDLSQTTGTRQKTFKTDRGTQKLSKNYNSGMTKSQRNKTRKILSSPNRDIKISTGYSSMSSGDIVPEIPLHNITKKSILPKKAPTNLSFKKVQKEHPSEKQSAKLRGFHKLSLCESIKEIEKAKNRQEAVDVTAIRFEEPHSEQRIFSSSNRGVTPLMVSPSASRTPVDMPPHTQSQHRFSRIARATSKSDISKIPSRSSYITRPQCRKQDQRRSSGRGYSRIPTLGQRAFGPQAIFGTSDTFGPPVQVFGPQDLFGTSDPFGPPVQGRMSTVAKRNPGSNEPPFQK